MLVRCFSMSTVGWCRPSSGALVGIMVQIPVGCACALCLGRCLRKGNLGSSRLKGKENVLPFIGVWCLHVYNIALWQLFRKGRLRSCSVWEGRKQKQTHGILKSHLCDGPYTYQWVGFGGPKVSSIEYNSRVMQEFPLSKKNDSAKFRGKSVHGYYTCLGVCCGRDEAARVWYSSRVIRELDLLEKKEL